jgi:hypothetical protein
MGGKGGKVWGKEYHSGPVQLLTEPFAVGNGIDALFLQTHGSLVVIGRDTVMLSVRSEEDRDNAEVTFEIGALALETSVVVL